MNVATIKKSFMDLPLLARFVVVFGVVSLVVYAYKEYKKTKQAKKLTKAEKTDISAYDDKGVKRSFDFTNYISFAARLEQAFKNNGGFGTNEDGVYQVFRLMKNDVDIIELEKAFGKRNYSGDWDSGYLTFEKPMGLSDWLSREMNENEMIKINKILSIRKIKKRY